MANARPTVTTLDQRMGGVEQQLGGLAESLGEVQLSILALSEGSTAQSERLWSALGNLGGLDGVAVGLAEIAEVLARAPVRPTVDGPSAGAGGRPRGRADPPFARGRPT